MWSASLAGILGLAPHPGSEPLSAFLARFSAEDRGRLAAGLESVEAQGHPAEWDVRLEGSSRSIRLRAEAAGGAGDLGLILGSCREISWADHPDGQYDEFKRMVALVKAATATAHDLNNLLTVVAGQAELIQAGLTQPSAGLSEIRKACGRASSLTNALLKSCRPTGRDACRT